MAALFAVGVFGIIILFKNHRELGFNIGEREKLLIEFIVTLLAIPLEAIELSLTAFALNHQAHAIGRALRRMRGMRRKQKNITGANVYPGKLTGRSDDLQMHIAFDLIEKFFALVHMKIRALVGSTHSHTNKLMVAPDHLIAHGWLQEMAIVFYPFC